jgi:hypothetical protein
MSDCPRVDGLRCGSSRCPGQSDPSFCQQFARLDDWRKLSTADQIERVEAIRSTIKPAVRDAVNACAFRGSVLPISMQDDCGCRGGELSECRAGRGKVPGRVTLRDCLSCQEVMNPSVR